jgi:phosphotriesterase-related protein
MSILTVKGLINKDDLGVTDAHDHLFIKLSPHLYIEKKSGGAAKNNLWNQKISLENLGFLALDYTSIKDNLILDDMQTAIAELIEFKKAGGNSLIDPTTIDLGRDPVALKKISNLLDINIITCTGYYKKEYNQKKLNNYTVSDIYKEMFKEITVGIGKTGVRAGIIGELGTGENISDTEKNVLIAAAKVNNEIGIPIIVHTEPWFPGWINVARQLLNILKENGANLEKVCLCHLSHGFFKYEYFKEIIDRGAFLGFDDFGEPYGGPEFSPSDIHKIDNLVKLIEDGYKNNILLGNDICHKMRLHKYGGWGYDHFLSNIIPKILETGVSNNIIDSLIKVNPKNYLDVPGLI